MDLALPVPADLDDVLTKPGRQSSGINDRGPTQFHSLTQPSKEKFESLAVEIALALGRIRYHNPAIVGGEYPTFGEILSSEGGLAGAGRAAEQYKGVLWNPNSGH
jgi:hypothetical protein